MPVLIQALILHEVAGVEADAAVRRGHVQQIAGVVLVTDDQLTERRALQEQV